MAQQIINTGTAPNDGTGDTLKTSFTKTNANFTELYTRPLGNAYVASATPPSSPNAGDFWYDLTTGILAIYINDGNSSQWVSVASGAAVGVSTLVTPQGRLTLQSGEPVMTTTQLAKTTIYYTPYCGNLVPIWNGSVWTAMPFNELTTVLSDTTKNPSAIGNSKSNDWFVWNDAGTLRLTHGPDWTDGFTRSAGTQITRFQGIWVNSVGITNGPSAGYGTYVGTTRSDINNIYWRFGTKTNGIAGSGYFGVWNCYNRVQVASCSAETADTWAVNTAWTQVSVCMAVYFVSGLAEDSFNIVYHGAATAASGYVNFGILYNGGPSFSGTTGYVGAGMAGNGEARFGGTAIGFNSGAAMECVSTVTPTGSIAFGDAGTPAIFQVGFWFTFRM